MRIYILTRQFLNGPEGQQKESMQLCLADAKALDLGP